MSRSDADLLSDISDAIVSIRSHLQHGPLSVEIAKDAVAMILPEIGEAVTSLSSEATYAEPEIPWRSLARMRDFLAHHCFVTNPGIMQAVIDEDLDPLERAVHRMMRRS